jgi:metacaspase-1
VARVQGAEPISGIRAVLVGVDEYERSDVPSLRGCVNDVALVRWLLKTYFLVPNENIRVVVNERATKAAILHRLEDMIRRARAGDLLVFYFSGHGSQIRDRDGDELTDSLDELICPYDMDWDSQTYILDDDLDEVFRTLSPDVILEAFFDCCFWGASPRGLGPPDVGVLRRDVRYLPPPFDIAARAEGDEDRLDIHRLQASDVFTERNVVWGATAEGQEAAEDVIDGEAHGTFTYWGCRFIAENIERIDRADYSRERLLEDVRGYLHALGYVQTPELSAPGELREATPLLPSTELGAWVEVGPRAPGRPRG